MHILIDILIPFGLLVLRLFHTSHTDEDGVPDRGSERAVLITEGLIAVLLGIALVRFMGFPTWAAMGFVLIGLYIHDVRTDLIKSLRKHAVTT